MSTLKKIKREDGLVLAVTFETGRLQWLHEKVAEQLEISSGFKIRFTKKEFKILEKSLKWK